VTVPIGDPAPKTGRTVAVKVMACPTDAGSAEDANVVAVSAGATVRTKVENEVCDVLSPL
jgi:hypothetical protein